MRNYLRLFSIKAFLIGITILLCITLLNIVRLEYRHVVEFETSLETRDTRDAYVNDVAQKEDTRVLPWFFAHGTLYPNREGDNSMHDHYSDSIIQQLMFVPSKYYERLEEGLEMKTILLPHGTPSWYINSGREEFEKAKCPVSACTILPDNTKLTEQTPLDLVLHRHTYWTLPFQRNPKTIHAIYMLESPYHTKDVYPVDVINWTATYRRDSDIVTPYGKWVYYDENVQQKKQSINYALNKKKKVAWFVSNCDTTNNRLGYAKELQKYIQVDIYGGCGNMTCARSADNECFKMIGRDYKFYLAFENSNCYDYITEKLFENALSYNILPIVMGGRPQDYKESAPRRSYIHVDQFRSPKKLAEYLYELDANDDLYNSYFEWKSTGEFINTFFWCRVCAMLHNDAIISQPKWYPNINSWWKNQLICNDRSSWRYANWL